MRCSESTGKEIDDEARKILKNSMEQAVKMLEDNREKMVEVAELLLKRETITSVDMEKICGERKGRSPTGYMNIVKSVDIEETKEEVKDINEEESEKIEKVEENV